MKESIIKSSVVDKSKLKRGSKTALGLVYSLFRLIILLSIGFIIMYPLFYMIVTSFQSKYAFLNSTRVWIPSDTSIVKNYKVAIECLDYGKALLSTLKNEISSALLQVVSCAVAAYGFARFEFRGKRPMIFVLFLTILVPDMILIIPRMVNFSHLDFLGIFGLIAKLTGIDLRLNVLNTSWTFWLPALFGVGLRSGILIYIYMQFFRGLPRELEEAAWVDGAGPIKTFLAIAVPSSGVAILTVTVFSLIWHWNDSLLCGIYLTNDFPLAMTLKDIETTIGIKYNMLVNYTNPEAMAYLMAGCVLFVTPMLIVYIILQRWFIESIDRVGITG